MLKQQECLCEKDLPRQKWKQTKKMHHMIIFIRNMIGMSGDISEESFCYRLWKEGKKLMDELKSLSKEKQEEVMSEADSLDYPVWISS